MKKKENKFQETDNQGANPIKNEKSYETEQTEDINEIQNDEEELNENDLEKTEENWAVKYQELHEKYLRIHAEFDNYRKRTMKERMDLMSSANAGILKELISILDDFERAMSSNEIATEIDSVKEGFQLIYSKQKSFLESKGLKPMHSVGESFDSELHEAIASIPAESDDMKGKIIEDVEKGYLLNDKVIRFAKVVVGN
ncbi:MAG: nucleotide exchange factor GrpE [Bacteroidota bacterium]